MTYDPRYHGCPGCGESEGRDCTCVGSDYEGGGFVKYLRSIGEIRCTCGAGGPRGWQHEIGCPFHPRQYIYLSEARALDRFTWKPGDVELVDSDRNSTHDSAEWIGREVRYKPS